MVILRGCAGFVLSTSGVRSRHSPSIRCAAMGLAEVKREGRIWLVGIAPGGRVGVQHVIRRWCDEAWHDGRRARRQRAITFPWSMRSTFEGFVWAQVGITDSPIGC